VVRKDGMKNLVLDAGEQGTFVKVKEGVVRFRFLVNSAFLLDLGGSRNIWLEFYSNSDTIAAIEA